MLLTAELNFSWTDFFLTIEPSFDGVLPENSLFSYPLNGDFYVIYCDFWPLGLSMLFLVYFLSLSLRAGSLECNFRMPGLRECASSNNCSSA